MTEWAATNLALSVLGTTSISMTWTVNAYSPWVWYQWVSRSTNGVNYYGVFKGNDDASSYTDLELTPGTLYYYRIDTYNYEDEEIGQSNVASATTATEADPVTLATPTNLTAVPIQGTKVEINFTDNSIGEDYHCVERNSVEIVQLAAGTTYYLNTGLTPGTTYTYRVRDKHDSDYSSYSSTANATPPKPFTHIAYGTGTTAEGVALTTLTTEIARAAATIELISTYTANDTVRFSHEFVAGGALTITEIGVFDAASTGNMLGRKLINSGTGVDVAEGDLFMVTYNAIIKDSGCGN